MFCLSVLFTCLLDWSKLPSRRRRYSHRKCNAAEHGKSKSYSQAQLLQVSTIILFVALCWFGSDSCGAWNWMQSLQCHRFESVLGEFQGKSDNCHTVFPRKCNHRACSLDCREAKLRLFVCRKPFWLHNQAGPCRVSHDGSDHRQRRAAGIWILYYALYSCVAHSHLYFRFWILVAVAWVRRVLPSLLPVSRPTALFMRYSDAT